MQPQLAIRSLGSPSCALLVDISVTFQVKAQGRLHLWEYGSHALWAKLSMHCLQPGLEALGKPVRVCLCAGNNGAWLFSDSSRCCQCIAFMVRHVLSHVLCSGNCQGLSLYKLMIILGFRGGVKYGQAMLVWIPTALAWNCKIYLTGCRTVSLNLPSWPDACLIGLPMEAVNVLQDNGLWRYAATLAAHALKRDEQSAALDRWAVQIHQVQVIGAPPASIIQGPSSCSMTSFPAGASRVLLQKATGSDLKFLMRWRSWICLCHTDKHRNTLAQLLVCCWCLSCTDPGDVIAVKLTLRAFDCVKFDRPRAICGRL